MSRLDPLLTALRRLTPLQLFLIATTLVLVLHSIFALRALHSNAAQPLSPRYAIPPRPLDDLRKHGNKDSSDLQQQNIMNMNNHANEYNNNDLDDDDDDDDLDDDKNEHQHGHPVKPMRNRHRNKYNNHTRHTPDQNAIRAAQTGPTFHEWHESWLQEHQHQIGSNLPPSVYHVGGFTLRSDAGDKAKGARSRFDPDSFRGRLSRYVSPKSCVKPCAERGPVTLQIPKQYRYVLSKQVDRKNKDDKEVDKELNIDPNCKVTCLFQQHVLVIPSYSKLVLQNYTVPANCTLHPRRAVCPFPLPSDCIDYCWNEWHVSAHPTLYAPYPPQPLPKDSASKQQYWSWSEPMSETHFYDLHIVHKRPFKIVALYPDLARPELLQVISYYMPNSVRPDNCNRLYCIYEYPNGDLERFQAVLGDISVTYCPVPTRSGIQTLLRLTYDHWTLSLPYPLNVEPIANYLPHVFMSICSIVKKEGPNLREWFEFHIMMGYERFILYDNNSSEEPDTVMDDVLKMYRKYVVIRKWPHRHSQTEALTDCIIRYGQRTEWMTFIDVDEFLVPSRKFKDIREPLKYYVTGFSYLHSNWVTFGPCGNLTKRSDQVVMDVCRHVTKSTSNSPKSTFRPSQAISMQGYSPHYIRLRKDVGGYPRSRSYYVNDLFRVYHYRYRSWEEFVSRRKGPTAGRVMVWDSKRFREEWDVATKNSKLLTRKENDINRFVPELKRRLGIFSALSQITPSEG
eukprot:TRINITY_DN4913_c0_g2_i1.p1 TRINITY_DN4913_c0_g2~~TRINITY_DN4913_c0_g2_i1.p1  ORF type:complete len:735 (+),score=145.71 TRINITY_DN4913_c0_g2_i1:161-2365(+)